MLKSVTNSIKHWAQDDRPREKLLTKGADALSNSELLGILIVNGTKNKSAVDLGMEVLQLSGNNLDELGKLSLKKLQEVKGIGTAKAIAISAALELGRRRHSSPILLKQKITSSKDVAEYLKTTMKDLGHEEFVVIYLNQSSKILHLSKLSKGGITGTVVDIRLIMEKAIELRATSLVLSHNHPSGNLKPSRADEVLTERIKQAATLLDVKVIDHIIVSNEGYYSFADEGLL